jgi:tryptophanyl-tRNA synthetase
MVKTIVGIRPTGKLHIGHYFSVIKPAQKSGADVLIAKYHCSPVDIIACINLEKELQKYHINTKIQEVNSFWYFELLSVARLGELERMTQYKASENKSPHLLIYPVLMAHDLLNYDKVIVGRDQKQHIEYANKLFKRLNLHQIEGDYTSGKIMSLVDPTKKMSKSDPKGCLFLDDNFEEKLKGAITDVAGVLNLSQIARQLGMEWNPKNNLESKKRLAEVIRKELRLAKGN